MATKIGASCVASLCRPVTRSRRSAGELLCIVLPLQLPQLAHVPVMRQVLQTVLVSLNSAELGASRSVTRARAHLNVRPLNLRTQLLRKRTADSQCSMPCLSYQARREGSLDASSSLPSGAARRLRRRRQRQRRPLPSLASCACGSWTPRRWPPLLALPPAPVRASHPQPVSAWTCCQVRCCALPWLPLSQTCLQQRVQS